MISLKSSDGEIFQVEVQVAKLSLLVKGMLDDLGFGDSEVISIPQSAPEISGKILGKILQWANHHKDDPVMGEDDDEKEVKSTEGISSWDAEFLQVDQTVLFQIIRAADYLHITGLLDVTCKTVAKMIKGSTPEEIRRRFNIPNDFSHDEEEQVRIENGWCDAISFPENHHDRVIRTVGKIRTKSVQDVEHDSAQVIQDCLSTSLVLRKVLQHFSNRELLELSCVNKSWSHESRSVMKKRGDVMARLVCSHGPPPYREDIEAFGAVLRQMNVVPFSGVAMEITDRGYRGGTAALDSTCEAILARMPLKLLAVELGSGCFKFDNSSALLPLKKLLQDFSGVLEQLTLKTRQGQVKIFERVLQDCIFTRLRVLKLRDLQFIVSDEVYTNYVKALVPLAPNLKELHVERRINLEQNVLEGSSAVLVYKPVVSYPFDQISDSVLGVIRLEKMELLDTGAEMDFERFIRIIPLLLQAPCTSRLRKLWTDEVLAVPLMCYGIRLETVRKLSLYIRLRLEPVQQEILRIVKNFDFTRIFPNLDEVCVFRHHNYFELLPHHINTVVQQANAVLREPRPDRAANVKELHLYSKSLFDETAPFFSEMFPTIEKMFILSEPEEEIPFGSIWKHWIDLKELQVERRCSPISNLDSVFCGIFPEEVAELRQMDEEYLKRVNIVPVMPAITCLKNLQALTFKLDGWGYRSHVDDGTLLFSKVTGFIAFERCPALAVSLVFRGYEFPEATRHLEPFASVTFESI